jgi:hypothetical protein
MKPPYIIQTIDRFFWTGAFWDVFADHAKQYPDRCSAIADLRCHGEFEMPWLLRPALVRHNEQHAR